MYSESGALYRFVARGQLSPRNFQRQDSHGFSKFEKLIPGHEKVWNLEFGSGKGLDFLKSAVECDALYSTCKLVMGIFGFASDSR